MSAAKMINMFQQLEQSGGVDEVREIAEGVVLVKGLGKYLHLDREVQRKLEDNYPVRRKDDEVVWGEAQWVEGDNAALMYRGKELKRGKMWFQEGDPRETKQFLRYYYTGWQYRVLPATSDINRCSELKPTYDAYNALVTSADPTWRANHVIVTHYKDGDANIGMHFDKTRSIVDGSLITIVKTGDVGRPFRITSLDGETELFNEVVQPGDAIVMTLEANTNTKHGVPELAGQAVAPSGSIVFRSIKECVRWEDLEKREEAKKRKRDAEEEKKQEDVKRQAQEASEQLAAVRAALAA